MVITDWNSSVLSSQSDQDGFPTPYAEEQLICSEKINIVATNRTLMARDLLSVTAYENWNFSAIVQILDNVFNKNKTFNSLLDVCSLEPRFSACGPFTPGDTCNWGTHRVFILSSKVYDYSVGGTLVLVI